MPKVFFSKENVATLKKRLDQSNALALPRVQKIVVHSGFGKTSKDAHVVSHIREVLSRITGQKPVEALAKKSISNFKLRKGSVIGMKVTLRGSRMYDFLHKVIRVTLPRVPDFRGIPRTSIDATGNIHIGFRDQLAFPEAHTEDISNPHGIEVSVVTNAKTRDRGIALFEVLGFPLTQEIIKKEKKTKR